MDQDLQHITSSLIEHIRIDTDAAIAELTDFANAYAFTPKLRHMALILKLNYSRAQEPAQQERLREEMIDLVGHISEDYQAKKGSKEVQQAQDAIQQLTAYFRDQELKRILVFESIGLGKTYKRSGFALQNVNIQLKTGEITGVVGENGNGKTTLFRLIAGDLVHDKGELIYPFSPLIKGKRLDWLNIKKRIAYVPQDLPNWYGSLRENLQFEAALHGIKGKNNHQEVDYMVQRLGLEDHMEKRWKELSGGYKLRFTLAKAIVWKPQLLIIDEPLANLDIKAQQVILKDLQDMANSFRYPMSILLSSQHLHEVEAISDKILFLKEGAVTFYGKTSEIGASRSYNTFELDCECGQEDLKAALEKLSITQLYHDGINYILKVPVEVSSQHVMSHLFEKKIEVTYFRNISRSVKKFFE